MKPLHAKWIMEVYDYMTSGDGKPICLKGWEVAGSAGAVKEWLTSTHSTTMIRCPTHNSKLKLHYFMSQICTSSRQTNSTVTRSMRTTMEIYLTFYKTI